MLNSSLYHHDNLSTCSILNVLVEDEMNSMTQRYFKFCFTCMCPCLTMGYIKNKLTRDHEFSPLYCCKYLTFGRQSISECCIVGNFCLCGWLCSPCLIGYVRRQRYQLISLYQDQMSTPSFSLCSYVAWPCILYQHLLFVEHQEKQKTLRFEDAMLPKPSPPVIEFKIALIGPDDSGRSSLFSKLLLLLPDIKMPSSAHLKSGKISYLPIFVAR